MSSQLLLTAKIFCLLALSNAMFNCFVYILAMATNLFSDFIVHFLCFITLEDGWLILVNETKHLLLLTMFKLLVILYIIKVYTQINIYKHGKTY